MFMLSLSFCLSCFSVIIQSALSFRLVLLINMKSWLPLGIIWPNCLLICCLERFKIHLFSSFLFPTAPLWYLKTQDRTDCQLCVTMSNWLCYWCCLNSWTGKTLRWVLFCYWLWHGDYNSAIKLVSSSIATRWKLYKVASDYINFFPVADDVIWCYIRLSITYPFDCCIFKLQIAICSPERRGFCCLWLLSFELNGCDLKASGVI